MMNCDDSILVHIEKVENILFLILQGIEQKPWLLKDNFCVTKLSLKLHSN